MDRIIGTHYPNPSDTAKAVEDFCKACKVDPGRVSRVRSGPLYDTADISFSGAGAFTELETEYFRQGHVGDAPLSWWTNGPVNGQMPGDSAFIVQAIGWHVFLLNPASVNASDVAQAMSALANAATLKLSIGNAQDQDLGPALMWGLSGSLPFGVVGGQPTAATDEKAFAIGGQGGFQGCVPLGKPLHIPSAASFKVTQDYRAGIIPSGADWASLGLATRLVLQGTHVDLVQP